MDYVFVPTIHTRLCNKHFNIDGFINNDHQSHLKPNAIPTKMMGVRCSLLSSNSLNYIFIHLYLIL